MVCPYPFWSSHRGSSGLLDERQIVTTCLQPHRNAPEAFGCPAIRSLASDACRITQHYTVFSLVSRSAAAHDRPRNLALMLIEPHCSMQRVRWP